MFQKHTCLVDLMTVIYSLQSSFRMYGAKTSRHVFLFEKGVLIAKRKENSMLNCKIFIEVCSLLTLFYKY